MIGLICLSMMLGNDYEISDAEFLRVTKGLGIQCKDGYCTSLRHAVIQHIDLSFTITKYEEFLYPKTIALHLCHSHFLRHARIAACFNDSFLFVRSTFPNKHTIT